MALGSPCQPPPILREHECHANEAVKYNALGLPNASLDPNETTKVVNCCLEHHLHFAHPHLIGWLRFGWHHLQLPMIAHKGLRFQALA